jgi:hypothetical protein
MSAMGSWAWVKSLDLLFSIGYLEHCRQWGPAGGNRDAGFFSANRRNRLDGFAVLPLVMREPRVFQLVSWSIYDNGDRRGGNMDAGFFSANMMVRFDGIAVLLLVNREARVFQLSQMLQVTN